MLQEYKGNDQRLTPFESEDILSKASRTSVMGTKNLLLILSNWLIIGLIALPDLILYLIGEPYQRGFYCQDESISKPYLDSTIPSAVLYLFCFLTPAVFVVFTEIILKTDDKGEYMIGKCIIRIPEHLTKIYNAYVGFLLGQACAQCLTDTAKYTIGRLRPHFFDVCKPDWSQIECSNGSYPNFVTNYTCLGNTELFSEKDELDHRIKESHLSFFSGHASASFSSMIFVILYLQARLANKRNPLPSFVVPMIQLGLFILAFYTSLSRISDYKHHPADVVTGVLVGTLIQIVMVVWVLKLFRHEEDNARIDALLRSDEGQKLKMGGYGSSTRVYASQSETISGDL